MIFRAIDTLNVTFYDVKKLYFNVLNNISQMSHFLNLKKKNHILYIYNILNINNLCSFYFFS